MNNAKTNEEEIIRGLVAVSFGFLLMLFGGAHFSSCVSNLCRFFFAASFLFGIAYFVMGASLFLFGLRGE